MGLRIRMGVGGLLWLRHNNRVGDTHIVCRLLIVKTLVERICRELLAEPGTVQYCHSVMVYERNALYAPLVGVAENNVDVSFFQS